MEPARLTELRLTDFKSFHDEVLPLGRLTVLIGGNAAGKSNALEGLAALSRLAAGLTLREALTGSSHSPSPIRGGAEGCAPVGRDSFGLGCTIHSHEGTFGLDVVVRTGRELSLQTETLSWPGGTVTSVLESGPRLTGGAERLNAVVIGAIPLDYSAPGDFASHLGAAQTVVPTLRRIKPIDPDPQTMRGYATRGNAPLLPDGSNLSAVIDAVRGRSEAAFSGLEEAVGILSDGRITGLDLAETSIGDVQLLIREGSSLIPARLASDGTLRFIAFATALFDTTEAADPRTEAAEGLLMIEEIERGLYPAQAGTLLDLIRRQSATHSASVIVTTHSPALLSALRPEEHPDVIVCSRDPESGSSRLRRLTELPGYPELIAAGGLGEAVTGDGLDAAQRERPGTAREFFDFLESL